MKNVTRTVHSYERIGASAIFIEDQKPPKRCGHMAGKTVVPPEFMEEKIKAGVAARSDPGFFLLARTDAIEPHGIDDAIGRGRRYLDAGADGIYVEGPRTSEELEEVGEAFRNVPLATSVLERGGKTPWTSPSELHAMGYDMILYPVTVLFRAVRAMQLGLADLLEGRPLSTDASVDLPEFESIVAMEDWADIENRFMHEPQSEGILRKVRKAVSGE